MLWELVEKNYPTLSGMQFSVRQKATANDIAKFDNKPDAELFLTLMNCYPCRKTVLAAQRHTHCRGHTR